MTSRSSLDRSSINLRGVCSCLAYLFSFHSLLHQIFSSLWKRYVVLKFGWSDYYIYLFYYCICSPWWWKKLVWNLNVFLWRCSLYLIAFLILTEHYVWTSRANETKIIENSHPLMECYLKHWDSLLTILLAKCYGATSGQCLFHVNFSLFALVFCEKMIQASLMW